MILAHYANRLPGNYDLGRIRALTVAAAVGVDTRNRKFTPIPFAYQILDLARPLLDTLAKGDHR
jgi:hypothetical protein